MMRLHGASGNLDRDGIEAWLEMTEDLIRDETKAILGKYGEGLFMSVEFEDQGVLEGGKIFNRILTQDRDAAYVRKLQSYSLQINFTTTIEFNSKYDDWDANEMVAAGFQTLDQQEEYIFSLKEADSTSFESVESMTMAVDGEIITEEIVPKPAVVVEPNNTLYYIVGGAAVGGLLLILAGLLVYKRKLQSPPPKTLPPKETPQSPPPPTFHQPPPPPQWQPPPTTNTPPAQNYFGTIESREGEDDVSTLGDPYFGEGANANAEPHADNTVGESMISAERGMYEFGVGRERLNTDGVSSRMASTNTGGYNSSNPNIFGDDATYEDAYRTPNGYEKAASWKRVTVIAPAGKLGVVVDNQTGDMPVVHAIKETSVLNGKVNVGDLLLSVDEVDCRGLSAVQVSRLISSRSHNAARALVLQRGSGG